MDHEKEAGDMLKFTGLSAHFLQIELESCTVGLWDPFSSSNDY